MLNDIAGLYNAPDAAAFEAKTAALSDRFDRIERRLTAGPYFDGGRFSLVDAAFGPVFRYFDAFDRIADFGILASRTRVGAWRHALAGRPSIRGAADADYGDRLRAFLASRKSHLARVMAEESSAQAAAP